MARQSELDQLKRIENFSCPVHGIGFCQIDHLDGATFELAECPRSDCGLVVAVDISEAGEGARYSVRQIVTAEQIAKMQRIWNEMYDAFKVQVGKRLDQELEVMSRSAHVQLTVPESF